MKQYTTSKFDINYQISLGDAGDIVSEECAADIARQIDEQWQKNLEQLFIFGEPEAEPQGLLNTTNASNAINMDAI